MDGASAEGTPELEVRLLGPIAASRAGEPVALGGPKPRTLLALLALEPGRVVSVDRIVEALWPGDPPETSSHAVQVYVSQLRKALGPAIATRAPGYELELAPERVDVHRFARLAQEGRAALHADDAAGAEGALREALALWRGPALADFLYEPFAQTEIARLEELRTVVLEERIDADLALGRHAELAAELEALVQSQPLRERPRAQLMLALYRSGRQADALAAYRAARETLVEELGIDPGPELRELEAAILRQDASLLLEEAEVARPAMQYRRLASILFCDVVDSMAIAAALDPESLAGVQRRYFETVSATILRHGGTVEKYAGDAVMAVFGVPIAYEDHALRAARSALEIRAGVSALAEQLEHEYGFGLEVRTGIAAGEVVATSIESRQRFVAGDAVGIAARLGHAAEPGQIVVGEVVARLIDHVARLDPLGHLEIKGRSEPFAIFRLVELTPAAPASERRLDAPLVGRKRELAALRRSLKRAVDSGRARVAVVVAPPGVGKSRLVAEFARRARGVDALWGRCLSYGDGITYWPLREALAEAGSSDERAAVHAALEVEASPSAPEIALLFRHFCEVSARVRPLILVFDDVHWAEPTLLELIEHLADKGEAPIHVVCLAREELDERRSTFLAGRANVDRIEPDALSPEDTEALVDALGGSILESDQRTRLVETAEGNPLFLEQLLAVALEGELGADRPPETIQTLLAARLDRLGPGERAVLERGAVVGREFGADDVIALLEPDAAPTAAAHLATLAGRGFVRPRGEGVFGFRHVLVQDAVYRAAPKRLRAELHERYADRLDAESPDLAELDEFVGYHLEQAYRLRTELGEGDRRAEQLAEDAGRRLGAAGVRALKRGDMHATVTLLGRATSLLPELPLRATLTCELAIAIRAQGDPVRAEGLLSSEIEAARRVGDRRIEMRARLERDYVQLLHVAGTTGDQLLEDAEIGIPIFESATDDRALSRAWLLSGFVHGGRRAQYRAYERAVERALAHYGGSGWPTSTCLGELGYAVHNGPTSVSHGIARLESLRLHAVSDRAGDANVIVFIAGLLAQLGDFDAARQMLVDATATYEDLGQSTAIAYYSAPVQAEIELLAGDAVAAEGVLLALCQRLEEYKDWGHLASRAGDLGEALCQQGRFEEAEQWTHMAEIHMADDDVDAGLIWRPVRARILAHRGNLEGGEALASGAVRLAETTDALNRRAQAAIALGEVHALAGRTVAARESYQRALGLYEMKGNAVRAGQMRTFLDGVARV